MAAAAPDFYAQKTDDELLFFVQNPSQYAPELVVGATQALRRRGVVLPGPHAPTEYVAPAANDNDALRGWLKPVALGVGLLVLGGGTYSLKQSSDAAAAAAQARLEAKRRLPPPQLVEAPTHTIPNYDGAVARIIAQQLRPVPAAEQADAQQMRQFCELAKRFWTAECQTEYVFEQARQGKMDAALPGHVESAMATWQQWYKANAYRYQFGPKMTQHLDAMARVAQQQQEGLADLLIVARNPQSYETAKTRQREADVNDLLSSLLTKSPATGKPYPVLIRKMHM